MSETSGRFRSLVRCVVVAVTFLALAAGTVLGQGAVYASGNPPSKTQAAPKGGINTLHGGDTGLKHGVKRVKTTRRTTNGAMVTSSNVTGTDPIVMVHGILGSSSGGGSTIRCTIGNFTNPKSYLQGTHSGLGSDTIHWAGPIYMVGYYNSDTDCNTYISTNNNPYGDYSPAAACNGVSKQAGGTVSNNDSSVGTVNEPIEHISCELSWYIYDNFSEQGENVKVLAYSMGGLVARYMIEQVQAGNDRHFAPFLDISDVVTFSSPLGGITDSQLTELGIGCNCYQASEMQYDTNWGDYSKFMLDIYNHDHPNAAFGTDWTMLGSLGIDPLDWDYQATTMSNSGGLSNNHRIGYNYPIKCNGVTTYSNGYDHGDYVNDACDAFDAPYYYCDGCSENQHTWFNYTTGAPHSLHEMLFAFVYANW